MTARKLFAVGLVLVALVLLTVPSGGFGVVDEVRDARVGVAAADRAIVSVEPAAEVPVRCAAPLVTVRNNAAQSATVTVRLTESGGGSLRAPSGADHGTEYAFDLAPGAERSVSVAGIGAGADAVEVAVTAETDGGVVVTTSERVPTYAADGGSGDDGEDEGENGDGHDRDEEDGEGDDGEDACTAS